MEGKQRKNTGHVTNDQKQALVEFIEMNPAIKTGKYSQNFTHKDASLKWEKAAEYFNSIPGSRKDWQSWRKCWHDIKNDVRSKAAKIKSYESGTGGGPRTNSVLSELEERVRQIIGTTCITGHNIKESDVLLDLPNEKYQKENEPYIIEFLETDSDGDDPGPSTSKQSKMSIQHQRQVSHGDPKPQSPKYQARKRTSSSSQRFDNCVKTANAITENISSKNAIKEAYYKKKLELMERKVKATEDKAKAKERSASSLERMGTNVANIATAFTKLAEKYS